MAAAALVMLPGSSSGSKISEPVAHRGPAAKPRPAVDNHGFPRTLSFNKCGDPKDLARRDMLVGYAYCDIATLRRLNPKGVFLVQPGLFPTESTTTAGTITVA